MKRNPMNTSVPDNTPVVVCFSTVEENTSDLEQSHEAVTLMTNAALQAAKNIHCEGLLKNCNRIYVPEGMWAYKDPARLIAEKIGADNATSVFAKIGITQQTLMSEACQRIQQGLDDIVLVCGGEAKFRNLQAIIQGVAVEDSQQADDLVADVVISPEEELWLPEETAAGFGMPVTYYAAMESAYRASRNADINSHRDYLAELYASFTRVAAGNPQAWSRKVLRPEEIRNPDDKNPMLAFPYTKRHNSSWNVNQACAIFFTSIKKAKEWGIDESHFIYPYVATENNAMLAVAARPQIHRSVGAELAAKAALEHSGLNANDIDIIDLYSCFPFAVEVYADAFGFTDIQSFTCTGGMPFAGGPLNNYALQAACRVFELLQKKQGSIGLTSSVSGLMTKQAFGLWSQTPPEIPFDFIDVTAQVRALEKPLPVVGAYSGEAEIVGYTVSYEKNCPQRLIAICNINGGRRTVCYSEDSTLMATAQNEECCGKTVTVEAGIIRAIKGAR
ncbi:MAG: hypothetical protein KDI30_05875 [Pseudomonadales bacterium]|nr:hypothetical protein [Pseudomonadales bacterium]